jgi:hypothetical protein
MPEDNSEPLNKTVKVTPSVHTALVRARRGDMMMNDVIADALRDYEPAHYDHTEPLEKA